MIIFGWTFLNEQAAVSSVIGSCEDISAFIKEQTLQQIIEV